jgi:hypothetical protein
MNIRGLNLADKFVDNDKGDLECTVPRLVLKRPYFSDLWRVTSVLGPVSSVPTLDTQLSTINSLCPASLE